MDLADTVAVTALLFLCLGGTAAAVSRIVAVPTDDPDGARDWDW